MNSSAYSSTLFLSTTVSELFLLYEYSNSERVTGCPFMVITTGSFWAFATLPERSAASISMLNLIILQLFVLNAIRSFGLFWTRIVGSLARNHDVVRMALLHSGVGDACETCVVQFVYAVRSTVAHA